MSNRRPQALRERPVPTWWQDAKLGIFVHWTPASVPAFAPVGVDMNELLASGRADALAEAPYAEWYENSLRFPDSPVARHHRGVYGDRPYERFATDWEAGLDQWDPEAWAARFAATGARHVVLVAKHADGYCLWPTAVRHPRRRGWHCERDVVGELAEAVRGAGMRFGLYYCGGLDWSFVDRPMGSMADTLAAIPRGDYPAYAEAQVRELIDRYRPSVLWNDVAWPAESGRLWPLFEHYYRQVPDGVVNDRWMPWSPWLAAARTRWGRRAVDAGSRRRIIRDGGLVPPIPPHFDVRTPEYVVPDDEQRPWECVRGMDASFGHNAASRPEDFISRRDLLWLFTDVVARGGNLLLNVGPRGVDAQIPDEQVVRLEWLSDWVTPNHGALAATRPWVVPGTTTTDGTPVRYTSRDDTVFAFLGEAVGPVTLPDVAPSSTTDVRTLSRTTTPWRATGAGLEIDLPPASGPDPTVVALRRVTAARRARHGSRAACPLGSRAGRAQSSYLNETLTLAR
jgi:alpha-L-fucosidase